MVRHHSASAGPFQGTHVGRTAKEKKLCAFKTNASDALYSMFIRGAKIHNGKMFCAFFLFIYFFRPKKLFVLLHNGIYKYARVLSTRTHNIYILQRYVYAFFKTKTAAT